MPGIHAASGWKRATIFDAAGNAVQFDEIVSDRSSWEPEPILTELTNSSYQSGQNINLSIASTLWDGIAQLRSWADDKTPVGLVVEGDGKHVQWYELLPMNSLIDELSPDRRQGDSSWQANMEVIDERPGVFAHINLLHGFLKNGLAIKGWTDGDADGLADGYSAVGAIANQAFAAGVQSFDANVAGEGIERRIRFPLAGVTLTLSWEFTAVHSESTELILEAQDFAGTPLATFTQPVNAPGRANVAGQLPASTYWVRVFAGTGAGITVNQTISIADPALRLDGQAIFIAG